MGGVEWSTGERWGQADRERERLRMSRLVAKEPRVETVLHKKWAVSAEGGGTCMENNKDKG